MTDKPDKWFDERIEPYLDGVLPEAERRLFEAHLKLDPVLAAELSRARRISGALAALPRLKCPSDVRRRVLEITAARPFTARRWAWAGAAAALAAIALTVALRTPPDRGPSAAELAQARAEVALALAYLDRAGRLAGREVGDQWVSGGIIKPVSAGLNLPAVKAEASG